MKDKKASENKKQITAEKEYSNGFKDEVKIVQVDLTVAKNVQFNRDDEGKLVIHLVVDGEVVIPKLKESSNDQSPPKRTIKQKTRRGFIQQWKRKPKHRLRKTKERYQD